MKSNGLLLIDKPAGWFSTQVVREVKKIFHGPKVGHAGTLDPQATGLLVVGLGEGTKALHYLIDQSKRYEARVVLGVKTATGDGQGQVIETRRYPRPETERIESLLRRFVGEIQQVPPMYSAVKIGGKRLYELARKQLEVERKPRNVMIYSLVLQRCLTDGFCFEVHCSKGTYVRTLAEDMGAALGTVAYLAFLRRTESGHFSVNDAIDIRRLIGYRDALDKLSCPLLPIDAGLTHLPAIELDSSQSDRMRRGGEVVVRELQGSRFCVEGGMCRVYDGKGSLLAVAVKDAGCIRPKRIFNFDPVDIGR